MLKIRAWENLPVLRVKSPMLVPADLRKMIYGHTIVHMKIKSRRFGLFLAVIVCCLVITLAQANAQVFRFNIDVPEASGIAAVNERLFLVVDDELGVFQLDEKLIARLVISAETDQRLDDLEGICISDDRKTVFLLSEKGGKVFRAEISITNSSVDISRPAFINSLPEIGKKANKGWEGIAFKQVNEQDYLVAVHQEKPVAIGVFRLPELEKISLCLLPSELEKLLKNLSGVAVSPLTGNLFLLSGKSRRIVEIMTTLDKGMKEITIVSKTDIVGSLTGHPEGICFDSNGNIVVVTDGSSSSSDFLRFSE
jgi:uncharacterized protein YjiK